LLAVVLADEPGHAQREAQPRLDGGVARASVVMSVLLHGAGLTNAGDVRHELRAQDVDQLLRDGLEWCPRRVVEGLEIGSWRRLAWGHLIFSLPVIRHVYHSHITSQKHTFAGLERDAASVDPVVRHSTYG